MKKTLYISALALMLAGFSLTSCSDFLEAKDKTNGDKDADSYLNSNPGALLMSAYNSLYNHVTEVPMTDEGTDLYIVTRGQTASEFDSFSFNPSTGAVQELLLLSAHTAVRSCALRNKIYTGCTA